MTEIKLMETYSNNVPYERSNKHVIQLYIFIFQYILKKIFAEHIRRKFKISIMRWYFQLNR